MGEDKRHETRIRVRYKDTDRMGVDYYGNYFTFFEVGRTELLWDCGCPYAEIEAEGFNLVVIEAKAHYHASARYDSILTVETLLQGEGWDKGWSEWKWIAGNFSTVTERSFGVPDGVNTGNFGLGIVIYFFGFSSKASGFPVDFSNGFFKRFQRLGNICMLSIDVFHALGLLFEFVDSCQVNGAQSLDSRCEGF